jgi:hypothetical protein
MLSVLGIQRVVRLVGDGALMPYPSGLVALKPLRNQSNRVIYKNILVAANQNLDAGTKIMHFELCTKTIPACEMRPDSIVVPQLYLVVGRRIQNRER